MYKIETQSADSAFFVGGDGDLPYFLHSLNPFWYVILYHFRFVSSTALAKHHILPPLEKGEVDCRRAVNLKIQFCYAISLTLIYR